jgi:hypothetical protein
MNTFLKILLNKKLSIRITTDSNKLTNNLTKLSPNGIFLPNTKDISILLTEDNVELVAYIIHRLKLHYNCNVLLENQDSLLSNKFNKIHQQCWQKVKKINKHIDDFLAVTTEKPALFVVGDSTVAGEGVNVRFSDLLSSKVKIDTINLSQRGSPIQLSLDLINHLPNNSYCVWGVTSMFRHYCSDTGELILPGINSKYFIKPGFWDHYTLTSEWKNLLISKVSETIDFAAKKNIKLVIMDLYGDAAELKISHNLITSLDLARVDNGFDAIWFGNQCLDPGHIGQKTHQMYADKILQKFTTVAPEIINI